MTEIKLPLEFLKPLIHSLNIIEDISSICEKKFPKFYFHSGNKIMSIKLPFGESEFSISIMDDKGENE